MKNRNEKRKQIRQTIWFWLSVIVVLFSAYQFVIGNVIFSFYQLLLQLTLTQTLKYVTS